MKNIVIGVSGSIAAYKAADLISKLKKEHNINVVMTPSATKFITPLTLQVLSKNKVFIDTFDAENSQVSHIELAKEAEAIVVAPASANTISKLASGICDNLLSTILIVSDPKKIILAPAMNTNMYENIIIQKNIQKLRSLGVKIIEPKESLLACGDYGKGALADLDVIIKEISSSLEK